MSLLPPIRDLIPQHGAMVLLDDLRTASEDAVTSRLTVRADSLFFEAGRGVAAHVAIEWMAQTCAVFIGLDAWRNGQPVRLGLLLGTRDFQANVDWFVPGQSLDVTAQQSFRNGEMAVFDCHVGAADHEGSWLAHAQLTVYQPGDVDALLQRQREEWGE